MENVSKEVYDRAAELQSKGLHQDSELVVADHIGAGVHISTRKAYEDHCAKGEVYAVELELVGPYLA